MLTALLVPAGMAYAAAASLPPVAGLYATVAALVGYALVGPSRVLVLGPDSSLTPLIAAAIIPLAGAGAAAEDRRLALAGLLALLVGAVLLVGGRLRWGFVAELFSTPIRLGYLGGVAVVVLLSQLPPLLGFSVHGDGLAEDIRGMVAGIADGDVIPAAAAVGLGALALILGLRRWAPGAPGLLLAVGAASVTVWALGLASVPVVGALPPGLPSPAWDSVGGSDVVALVWPAIGIALVAFADTGMLSRALASADRRPVDGSREMAALGIANLASGLAGGFPVSGSASRTPVARASGARTQVAGLVGAAAVALVVAVAPGLTRHLPTSALAAVVIAAVITMVDAPRVLRLARVNPTDFGLALLAFLAVMVLGVLWGVVAAVALSSLAFVARAWRPHTAVLARVDGRKGYHDTTRHPEGRQVPGLVILRFDAPLFFANAELFADFVRQAVSESPSPVRCVVLAAEPITDVDSTAAEVLDRLYEELEACSVRLALAELKGPVKDQLVRYGFGDRLHANGVYPTIGTAVADHVARAGVDWTDWEDAAAGAVAEAVHPSAR
jgi:high affinity sulfate transporter 1